MELIEPDHFDAVVVTSGLPEVLIASALARAGNTVLVLDAADSYGASWSSLNGADFVHNLLNRQLEQPPPQPNPDDAAQSKTTPERVQQHQTRSSAAPAAAAPQSGATQDSKLMHGNNADVFALHPVRPFVSLCSSAALYTHPEVEKVLENKQLIIDLAPKVLYQDESLVQLLVSCQAHNYLEFKLVEGSYIYQSGRLRPVPASRADLFADKSLSLADKRSLGRFLTACMEAQQGFGRLKDCFDSRPLVDLLASEGLSQTLQEVVLYGIAMADTPQQHQQQSAQADAYPTGAEPAANACSSDTNNNGSSSVSSSCCVQVAHADPLTASRGLAALQLYTTSLGRYGGQGAFMAPCYGCGSVPEAFARLAAVKGAVTALRHGASELRLMQGKQQQQQGQGQLQQVGQQPPQQQQQSQAEHGTPAAADSAAFGLPPATLSVDQQPTPAAAAAAAAEARVQIVLTSGQTITANTVVGCQDAFDRTQLAAPSGVAALSTTGSLPAADQCSSHSSSSSSLTAHAVALLDSSIKDDDNSLLLVFPPGSLGQQQVSVVRGLQFGPALAVTPPGKYLLYLSAALPHHSCSTSASASSEASSSQPCITVDEDSSSCIAEQVLSPAVDALLCPNGLDAFSFGQPEHTAATQSGSQEQLDTAVAAAINAQDSATAVDGSEEQQQQQQCIVARRKPQVLALCYYTTQQPLQQVSSLQQEVQQQPQQQQSRQRGSSPVLEGQQSSPILLCPSASPGYTGYEDVIKGTEAAYRQHFPDLPWLTDQVRHKTSPQANAATEGRGSADAPVPGEQGVDTVSEEAVSAAAATEPAGGPATVDDNNDAIDELTAALAELEALADLGK